ncbi:MAG: hypothetical protein E6Q27_00300 [Aeromicrobium sp.]|nr:MAG: hypothetical protein E6Q27_00300 [Aeromicrobium sp.]
MRVIKQHLGVFCTLLAIVTISGLGAVVVGARTAVPYLVLPSAVGTTSFIPPLRLTPLGRGALDYWLIDIIGVAVLFVAALLHLSHSARTHPNPTRAQAFRSAFTATFFALIAANVSRALLMSVLTDSSLGAYAGLMVGTILISILTGIALGFATGTVAVFSTRNQSEIEPEPTVA